jgi:hypothetical protein
LDWADPVDEPDSSSTVVATIRRGVRSVISDSW